MVEQFKSGSAGARFRKAVREAQPLQVAGAINAYTARLAEATGFRALYVSGGGVAANCARVAKSVAVSAASSTPSPLRSNRWTRRP